MRAGDKVVYYPAKANELDNRHFDAEVKGFTKTGRVQIEWRDAEGEHKATVAKYRIEENQRALL